MWMNTKYEPGTVKVVAYDKDGKPVAEKEMHTAGKPHHIELIVASSVIFPGLSEEETIAVIIPLNTFIFGVWNDSSEAGFPLAPVPEVV